MDAGGGTVARQPKVLLVDDHEDSLCALKWMLDPLGYQLVTASSGEQALKAVLQQEFSLILLDIVMPGGLDGLETASYLKRAYQSCQIPLLFITGMPRDPDCAFAGFSMGAADYIVKPVDPWELRAKVRILVDATTELRRLRAEHARLHEVDDELRRQLKSLGARLTGLENQRRLGFPPE